MPSPLLRQGVLDVPIYGRIVALRLLPVEGESTDRLFFLTSKGKFAVLKFDAASGSARACVCVRPRECGRCAAVWPRPAAATADGPCIARFPRTTSRPRSPTPQASW